MNAKTLAQQALRISQTGKLPLPDGATVKGSLKTNFNAAPATAPRK